MPARILLLPIVAIALIGTMWGCRAEDPTTTANQGNDDHPQSLLDTPKVVALGRLEPKQGIIAVSAVPGERLESLFTQEGQSVEDGDVLAQLASYSAYDAEVAAVKTQLTTAPQRWHSQIVVAEARVRQAEAALEQAKAKQREAELQKSMLPLLARRAQRARQTFYRLSDMAEEDVSLANEQELERYELERDKADIDHELAQQRYELAKDVAEKAVIAAEADVVTAEATLKELRLANPEPELQDRLKAAEIRRNMSQLRAPLDGKVLRIFLEEGEVITDRPILQLANVAQMVCVAEVYEADAKKIVSAVAPNVNAPQSRRQGDVVRIVSKAFDDHFEGEIWGTVEHVGSLVAPPGLQSRNPLAPADRSVVEVRVRIGLDNSLLRDHERLSHAFNEQAARLVSLQVNIEFYDRKKVAEYFASTPVQERFKEILQQFATSNDAQTEHPAREELTDPES